MAKDKKGFVLYADQIDIFEGLSNDEAGRLIKHIMRYVNDQDPINDDRIITIAFEPIKSQLKRDLLKYKATCDRNTENIKKRWEQKNAENIASKTEKEIIVKRDMSHKGPF